MKVILHNIANDQYIQDQGLWTKDPLKALDFGRADKALEAARQSGLKDLEVMISLNGIHFDISRPVYS